MLAQSPDFAGAEVNHPTLLGVSNYEKRLVLAIFQARFVVVERSQYDAGGLDACRRIIAIKTIPRLAGGGAGRRSRASLPFSR